MSHFASIANLKSKLEVDDMKGDKPVPDNIKKSFDDFKTICSESGFSNAIIERAWERSGKGYKLNNVSDLCWALMNSTGADLSERTTSSSKNKKMKNKTDNNDDVNDDDELLPEDNADDDEDEPTTSTSIKTQQSPINLISRQDIESTSLIKFYKELFFAAKVISDEQEWNAFLDSLCSPLPMCLRLHQQGPYKRQCADILLNQKEGMKKLIKPVEATSSSSSKTTSTISAYSCSNEDYRKATVEQDLSRTGHSGGLWSFQEFVSMLPVACLDIQPDHLVFDMCAAPGSKSLQALDALNGSSSATTALRHENIFNIIKNGGGCLVCNEKQPTKARQILPARMKRYGALQNVVCCADATKLPWIVYNDKLQTYNKAIEEEKVKHQNKEKEETNNTTTIRTFSTSAAANSSDAARQNDPRAYFDRIICDVPCCGDGTVRKDRTIFGTWNIDYVNQLSEIQLRIARRAVGMAKVGGLVAYSTCSMNPMEDEHVIFQLMCLLNNNRDNREGDNGEQIRLVDANEVLRRKCGVNLKSTGGIDLGQIGENTSSSSDSVWSLEKLIEKVPGTFKPSSLEEAKKLCTEIAQKVVRVLPHRDNTGGFFVALLEKVRNFPNTLPNPNKFQLFSNRRRFELVHPHDEEWKNAMAWFFHHHDNSATINRWKAVFPKNDGNDTLPVPHVLLCPASSSTDFPKLHHEPMIPFWCVSTGEDSNNNSNSDKNNKKQSSKPTAEQKQKLLQEQKENPNRKKRIHLTTISAARIVFNAQLAGGNIELVNFGVRLFERMPAKYLDQTVSQRMRIASEGADLIQPTKRVWTIHASPDTESDIVTGSQEALFIKNILLKGYYQFTLSQIANNGNNNGVGGGGGGSSNNDLPVPVELSSSEGNLVPGSFVFCFRFPSSAETWLAAMLTPNGKVDLLVDSSVRRMLLQVYFDVKLESNQVGVNGGGADAGRRRQREENISDDDDEE